MSTDDEGLVESPVSDGSKVVDEESVAQPRLYPDPGRIFARVAVLTRITGISDNGLEALDGWYQSEWRVIHDSRFAITNAVTDSLKMYFASRPSVTITAEEVERYLSAMCLLYYGLRSDGSGDCDVSKNKVFQRYYYTARENASALNSSIIMSNFIWACNKYSRNEFANTCLVDILLQAYPAALDTFMKLDGITYLKNSIDYLAMNNKLPSSTNYLLKALALLNKLDVSFKTLQVSRIGISINGIATAGKNLKLGIDYECENDQVKLKATDLIKKWKAIRDASQVGRVDVNARRRMKKGPIPQATKTPQDTEKISDSVSDVPKPNALQQNEQSTQSESGSFVLNILDSMVEQREKERKRKLAMKEAQRHCLFKVTKQVEADAGNRQETTTPSTAAPAEEQTNNVRTEEGTDESKAPESQKDKPEDGRKELQSLMNFFKTFKPRPMTGPPGEPSVQPTGFPPTGMVMPPMFPQMVAPGGTIDLKFPGNNYSYSKSPGAAVPPFQHNSSAQTQNLSHGVKNNTAKNPIKQPSIPPWR